MCQEKQRQIVECFGFLTKITRAVQERRDGVSLLGTSAFTIYFGKRFFLSNILSETALLVCGETLRLVNLKVQHVHSTNDLQTSLNCDC